MKNWYENIPKGGVLCWVNSLVGPEPDIKYPIRRIIHYEPTEELYIFMDDTYISWQWAKPLTKEEALQFILGIEEPPNQELQEQQTGFLAQGLKFRKGSEVQISISGEVGKVIGLLQRVGHANSYLIRYVDALGIAKECFWGEDALEEVGNKL